MFTGLVEAMGEVQALTDDRQGGAVLALKAALFSECRVGDSIAVSGACLTITSFQDTQATFQLGPETLKLTTLGRLSVGERVNLERSLRIGDRLGGHFVQGHVDGIGRVVSRHTSGEWDDIWFSSPTELTSLMVRKGSIAVDGVSLTLVDVDADRFRVMLIPHTLAHTTLGSRRPGDSVNLEADMIAKHIQKLVGIGGAAATHI
jgi:riboflavin synthase